MKLSLFTEVQCPPGASPERRLEELLEQAELGDALGYHGLWISEIHFQPEFSVLSAPYVVLGAISQRTRRLRLGVAVNILPVHHPLHLAEHAAMLDVLSHGRVEFAVGRGHVHSRVYEGFAVDRERSRGMLEESLQVIRAAWTQDTLAFEGDFYHVPGVVVNPKPLQKQHTPVYVASSSLEGSEAIGRLGLNLFLPAHLTPRDQLRDFTAAYWRALAAHGHDPAARELGLNVPVHVAQTTEQVRDEARDGFMEYFRVNARIREEYVAWRERQGRGGVTLPERQSTTYERLYAEAAVIGDPPTAVQALRRLVADTGATRLLCWMNMGSIPHAAVLRSMEQFAREVMPGLADLTPQPCDARSIPRRAL